jgi:HK97 family phage major capsid protein
MDPRNYSLAAAIRAAVANTWGSLRSEEKRESDRLSELAGEPLPPSRRTLIRVPGHALRDMTAAGVSGSNYLTGTGAGDYVESLTGDSAALRLGVSVLPIPKGSSSIATPKGSAGATAYWLGDENTAITESQPTLASYASASKTVAGFVQASHQLLTQAANAEQVIRAELRRAAATALDAAILAGTGANGQPTGIIITSGVGGFTGTSLDQAALRNAQADLGTAKAITDPSKVAYVAPPAVAELLAKRQRFTGSDRALWEGSSFDGTVEGVRAISTTAMPSATMILGDWSSVQILEFAGGLLLEVDPFSAFNTGLVSIRLLLDCDVLVPRPAAFSVATGIT